MKIRIRNKNCHLLLICAFAGFEAIKNGFLNLIRMIVHIPWNLDTAVVYFALALVAVFSARRVIRGIKGRDIAWLLILFFLIGITWIRYWAYNDLFIQILKEFALCAAAFLVTRALDDVSALERYLRNTAVFISIGIGIIFSLGFRERVYSMYYGYLTLPASIISCSVLFDRYGSSAKLRILHAVNFVLASAMCLLSGTRGPLLCIALYAVVQIMFGKSSLQRKILEIIMIVIASAAVIINIEVILKAVTVFARSNNLSVRIMTKISQGELLYDSGRSTFVKNGFNALNRSAWTALFGLGIGGDRIAIARAFMVSDPSGYYSHNIAVEMLLQFGYVIGALVLVALAVLIVRAFLAARKNEAAYRILWIFAAIGLFPLLVSDSYIQNPLFFCFLALCVNILSPTELVSEGSGELRIHES